MTRNVIWSIAAAVALTLAGCSSNSGNGDSDAGQQSSGDDGGSGCTNACSAGMKACEGNGYKVCQTGGNGCTAWTAITDCKSTEYCDQGSCKKNCTDLCPSAGTQACEGNGAKSCELQPNGCLGWSAVTPCNSNEVCSAGRCKKNCVDNCADGTGLCDAAGLRQCVLQSNGCYDWGTAAGCGAQVCSGGQCVLRCSNQCTLGSKMCSGSQTVECKAMANGCTDWATPAGCGTGKVCSAGQCVATGSCSNQCTLGATKCGPGGLVQKCVTLDSGCTDWTLPQACAGGETCPNSSDHCLPVPCQPGTPRCNGTQVETCDTSYNWIPTQSCPQACSNGQCVASASCTAGAVRCNGSNVEICNSAGSAWLFSQTCAVGCNAGVCTGACTAGDKRCNGNVPQTCDASGTSWSNSTACTTFCNKGSCVAADLVVDAQTVTLEGEQVFQNSVVVKNSGQIKVGASGWLSLKAANISVDATSSIIASAVGDVACSGSGSQWCCNQPSHTGGIICSSNSTPHGGAYGSKSTCGPGTIYATDGCNCVAADGDYSFGTITDTDISKGMKDGVGNLGGGLVQIQAGSVLLNGQLVSNGAGNASGGGILVAADSISGGGPVQAAGGGCGGNGRIKLLHGSTLNLTGSVTGARTDSVMPPMTLVSGTHPDPTRWYNDGLGDWSVAWDKPFPNVNGYYVLFSNTAVDVPRPSHGTFQIAGQETYTVPATSLKQGGNFFHVVSVDAQSLVGTVEQTTKVQVNTAPPAVSSSSHATQTTWYADPTLMVSWTNPQADANFTGFYYLLDHYGDTVSSTTSGTFLAQGQKQLILPNLTPGIWVFHLVNKDTRGATTKAAAHFYARIGTEPLKGSLSGTAFDGSSSNAPLSGVSISVNRGLLPGTTTASVGTYAFTNNIYEGTWEITASKAGYVSSTQTATITTGQTTTLNFTLVKAP